jgi:outer membrane protein OmpA-like peptidoglycan-associated protein
MNKNIFLAITLFFLVFKVTAQEQFSVFFDSNKHNLNKLELKKIQTWINSNSTVKIVAIHGFTDEDGTNVHNDSLSQKRVNTIFNLVKPKIKIRNDFKTISFGENFKQSKNKAQNRKAVIYYLLEKDIPRENEILGIKPVVNQVVEQQPEEIIPIEEADMNFPENATLDEKIQLSRKGTLIKIDNINFYLNSFGIMPTSKRAIDELLYVLDKNPKLKIEIQGHICCVDKDVNDLSTQRAKQVKRILVSEGISDKRLKTKGFGTTKPKFFIPEQTEEHAAQNRRVEIMVLSK